MIRDLQASRQLRSYTVAEIPQLSTDADVLLQVAHWSNTYLARSHPELGRPGAVCPFARASIQKQAMRIAVIRFHSDDRAAEIEAAVVTARERFRLLQAASGEDRMLNAILLAFPDVSLAEAPFLIDGAKEKLKKEFVAEGLMLGEFHADNQTGGLHNKNFRPLRSPVPLLVIREMVGTDIVFLDRSDYPAAVRASFLRSYLAQKTLSDSDRATAAIALQQAESAIA